MQNLENMEVMEYIVDSEVDQMFATFDNEIKNFKSLILFSSALFYKAKRESQELEEPNSFLTAVSCQLLIRIFN